MGYLYCRHHLEILWNIGDGYAAGLYGSYDLEACPVIIKLNKQNLFNKNEALFEGLVSWERIDKITSGYKML
ncbi:hypothetical protein A7K91_15615 [Paenibacillus oryzae]|uniref:Uncharacterized protein n=1 Tax=Paenibacillus oryzae TaxID=1844972 RepID=A0A1A5YB11_9BACL|nr:hypothetical protein A7K91_15615 [Paenibacillus oryzae]